MIRSILSRTPTPGENQTVGPRCQQISTAGNNAWVVVLDQEPLKTAAKGFKIYYIFLLPSVQTVKCVRDTTLRKTTIGGRAKQ